MAIPRPSRPQVGLRNHASSRLPLSSDGHTVSCTSARQYSIEHCSRVQTRGSVDCENKAISGLLARYLPCTSDRIGAILAAAAIPRGRIGTPHPCISHHGQMRSTALPSDLIRREPARSRDQRLRMDAPGTPWPDDRRCMRSHGQRESGRRRQVNRNECANPGGYVDGRFAGNRHRYPAYTTVEIPAGGWRTRSRSLSPSARLALVHATACTTIVRPWRACASIRRRWSRDRAGRA